MTDSWQWGSDMIQGTIKGLDPAKVHQVEMDVGFNTPVEESTITYGPAELEYRRRIEEELAEARKKDPRTYLDIRE